MIDWLRRPARPPASPPAIVRETVRIAGREVPLVVRRLARARRMTLRVSPTADEIRVSLPSWGRVAEARAFVADKADWIERHLAPAGAPAPKRFTPGPGAQVQFRGDVLAVAWEARFPRTPRLDDGRLVLGGPLDVAPARIARWLEREAMTLLTADLAHYCGRAGIARVPVLRLSRAQRRWGSCAADGTVRINWRLVMAPDEVRRSVVAHEVAHLVHFDHSPAFHRALAAIFDGDLPAANRWLARHGRSLYDPFG